MRNDNSPNQSGVVIFWKENNGTGPSKSLNLPAEGSGQPAEMSVDLDYSKIAMSDIPSATTITLSQGTGSNRRYIKLLTTHRPASLNRTEFQYLRTSYSVGDFISEGLGLKVLEQKGELNGADIVCHVQLSKSPPTA